jgi:hypothetical protein
MCSVLNDIHNVLVNGQKGAVNSNSHANGSSVPGGDAENDDSDDDKEDDNVALEGGASGGEIDNNRTTLRSGADIISYFDYQPLRRKRRGSQRRRKGAQKNRLLHPGFLFQSFSPTTNIPRARLWSTRMKMLIEQLTKKSVIWIV